MKKIIFQILAVAALIVAVACFTMQLVNQKRIVYVNSSKLLDQYRGMVDAREKFKAKTANWQTELDTLYSSLSKRIEDYEKSVASMNASEAKKEKERIDFANKQFQQHKLALGEKAKKEDARITEEVVKEVNTFIMEYCKKKRYRIVLGLTQAGNLIYAKDNIDITDEVIVALNRNYRGE